MEHQRMFVKVQFHCFAVMWYHVTLIVCIKYFLLGAMLQISGINPKSHQWKEAKEATGLGDRY